MRLEISRRADLAVRALLAIDRAPDRVKSEALAAELETTAGFIPQVVGPLVKRGWVRSDPGPRGGYSATVSLDRLSLLDVIEAVDGPTDVGRCVVAEGPCGRAPHCALHAAWARARDELVTHLAAQSMASLAAVPAR
jgi:Rrf2 family iron-sulfur cluster assembly transcriptional regulator